MTAFAHLFIYYKYNLIGYMVMSIGVFLFIIAWVDAYFGFRRIYLKTKHFSAKINKILVLFFVLLSIFIFFISFFVYIASFIVDIGNLNKILSITW